MKIDFMMLPMQIIDKQAITEIVKRNKITERFGLTLTEAEAEQLVATRTESLINTGRIEFGGGIIDQLIFEFCDSPYIYQENYSDTVNQLIEIFYYFKNESMDHIGDEELISLMKKYFDHYCQGSIDLLQGKILEILTRNIRYGKDLHADIPSYMDQYYEEEEDE